MRILVCGGRDFNDWDFLNQTLHHVVYDGGHTNYSKITIISGGARGADSLAIKWAKFFGCKLKEFPADWHKYGKSAGAIRNQQMIDEDKPDFVVAFPGGTGTADMIRRAKKAGITVREIKYA